MGNNQYDPDPDPDFQFLCEHGAWRVERNDLPCDPAKWPKGTISGKSNQSNITTYRYKNLRPANVNDTQFDISVPNPNVYIRYKQILSKTG